MSHGTRLFGVLNGEVIGALSFEVAEGLVVAVHAVLNPTSWHI